MMMNNVKFNFQSDPEYTNMNWKCSCRDNESPIESQYHLKVCPKYNDLHEIFDIKSDEGIVQFFDAVLQRRQEEADKDFEDKE